MSSHLVLLIVLAITLTVVNASNIIVQNKCGSAVHLVWRGPFDKVYYEGNLNGNTQWSAGFDHGNCGQGCNIGISTGSTLLAEFDHDGSKIWWNLSTDAGYQWPPFRFYSSMPNGPNMYCGDARCPDGTPGDSHIQNVPGQYDLIVQYCG